MIATALLAALLAAPTATPRSGAPPAPAAEAPPASLPDEEVAARVDAYLGAIDRPVPAAAWRSLGPPAVPHLEATLRSDDLPTRRAAAVAGLAAIGGDRARAAVLETARAEDEKFVVRSTALRATRRLTDDAGLVDTVGPVLREARSAHVRAVAAEVLAGAGDAGCGAVRAQATREGSAARGRYAKALSRCEGR
jgi:HEAT repeat protein